MRLLRDGVSGQACTEGVIYVRGSVPEDQLGPGLTANPVDSEDMKVIEVLVKEYAKELKLDRQGNFERKIRGNSPVFAQAVRQPVRPLLVGC